MQSEGLKVEGGRGTTHISPTHATDNPADVGPVDFVLFCVKLWDLETAAEAIKPLIGPNTAVIPLQNGIDASERLTPILGRQAVMGGVAQISASLVQPGVIRQVGTFMRIVFGELNGERSKRAEQFLALCQAGGFEATLSDQIVTELWMKFILLATNSSMTAATRQPLGKLRVDEDIKPITTAAIKEVIAIGHAKGIALPSDALERVQKFIDNAPAEMKASMALDLERGNRLEAPWLGGKVVTLGRELNVPTPVHSVLWAVLKPYVMGAQGA
jgi:2-dehydropantoate 2-reductase